MAAILATDVTYTYIEGTAFACPSDPMQSRVFSIAFGDGTKTYPTGGVPLTAAKMGAPGNILSVEMIDPAHASGYVVKYDKVNNKIVLYQIPVIASTPSTAVALVEVVNTVAPAAMTLYMKVKGW